MNSTGIPMRAVFLAEADHGRSHQSNRNDGKVMIWLRFPIPEPLIGSSIKLPPFVELEKRREKRREI